MINKKNVQCVAFFLKPHPIHRSWMNSISSRKIISYIPRWLYFGAYGIRRIPILAQFVSFLYGLFLPSAEIYLIEGVATAPCVLFKKGKVICINSDTFFYNMKCGSWLLRVYSRLLLKRIDGFISTSEMIKNRSSEKSSEVVYPFLENKSLFKIKPKFENNNICNISGMRYTKGTDILIKTFKEYKKIKPDAQLYCPGPNADGTNWINKIKEIGGIAPGFVPVEPFYKKCSIYINPARHEPFGVNIIEAMAAGIPPLATKNCGASEIVVKVDKNLIIETNANDILKKMNWLKLDKKRYYELSRKCKAVAKTLTKKKSNEEFKEKFTRLLGRLK